MNRQPVEGLARRAKAGDAAAFRVLWRQSHPRLVRYLRVVAGDGAEDVAAETWLAVTRDLDSFDGDDDFAGWVFTIARNRHLDWRRHEARRPADPVPVDRLDRVAADDNPARSLMEVEGTEAALALVAELPPDQAEVVALRTIGGLTVAEVAAVVGKRRGAVRVLSHRGLRRLAARLSEEHGARV